MVGEVNNVDRGILYLLQLDARNTTSKDIAEKIGVSASTIRNRIDSLEESGTVKGYLPEIDYESAGLPLHVMFVVTASPGERSEAVDKLMDIQGVVSVREMLTGQRKIHVEVVGQSTNDLVRITDAIHDQGVKIDSSEMIQSEEMMPFDHFYFSEATDEEVAKTESMDELN